MISSVAHEREVKTGLGKIFLKCCSIVQMDFITFRCISRGSFPSLALFLRIHTHDILDTPRLPYFLFRYVFWKQDQRQRCRRGLGHQRTGRSTVRQPLWTRSSRMGRRSTASWPSRTRSCHCNILRSTIDDCRNNIPSSTR